ncbi:MAG: cobalamin adenosyltransferase [Saprospiraceae bacterium]|nr:MAG: cobalamin adenosyltransferase [Saprospiraceae bacterium]
MAFKIYTKTGDEGQTTLFGGSRLPKSHVRIDAYGTVDELNSWIGMLCDSVQQPELIGFLREVQNRLFDLGAYLAIDPEKREASLQIEESDIEAIERAIDQMEETLPPLKNFILPGGHPVVSTCHIVRCVCRRAERRTVALHLYQAVDPLAIKYLNRLSDYFFVLARWLGKAHSVEEVLWKGGKSGTAADESPTQ